MLLLKGADHVNAFGRGEIEDFNSLLFQPRYATLGVDAVADDDLLELELRDESGAVPAWRERGDENEITVGWLSTGGAEGICLTVHGWVAVLDEAIAASAEEFAIGGEDGAAYRDAAFGKSYAGLLNRDG